MRNPNEATAFLARIRQLASDRENNVFVDLSEVKVITPDAIAALLATIHRQNIRNSFISGNEPKDARPREVLNESGFRNYVRSTESGQRATLGKIQKQASSRNTFQSKFDQFVAQELVEFGSTKLTGSAREHGPSYGILGEAMLNTLNHASATSKKEPWWASVYFDSERKRSCFTFVDQGVGIFRSSRLQDSLKILFGKLAIPTNAEILRRLFRGEIRSTTHVAGRGNGIPGIYAHAQAKRIREFAIIANNAIGGAESETYQTVSPPFEGTMLYWEVESHDQSTN